MYVQIGSPLAEPVVHMSGQTRRVHPSLSEVIDGRLVSGASEIVPTDDEPVRAVDVLDHFGAVYRFSVDESSAWFATCTLAVKSENPAWRDSGASGTHGDGWAVPWQPSSDTMDGHTILVLGSSGMELVDEEGHTRFVRAIYGFADLTVAHLRVSAASGERTIQLDSPVGAFVVLVQGESAVELQGLDRGGAEAGQPATVPPVEDSRARRRRLS